MLRKKTRLLWLSFLPALLSLEAVGSRAQTPPADARQVASATVVPGSEEAATVVLVVRVVNRSEAPLRSPRITLHTPLPVPQQTITELDVEGKPSQQVDRWGASLLTYTRPVLPPGQVLTGRWTASATIRRFEWDLGQDPQAHGPALSSAQQDLYLRDASYLALGDSAVRAAAEQATLGRTTLPAKLEGIFDLVMDRLSYDRDGRWDRVPQVLAAGKGSCSEYSYCFVGLCRVSGIPARYVGGIVGRAKVPFHLDTVFHRYPQAFVAGTGWVDFDPTRTDRSKNRRLYFARTSPHMLLTCVGDGGEGSLTGWDYLEGHSWSGEKTQGSSMRAGWWFPPPPREVRQRVAVFRQHLAASSGGARLGLVEEAVAIGHPFVLPWLDDLLYEPAMRIAASKACLKLGGEGVLRAVVNSLQRLPDQDGDRQIGELLHEFTGQNWGSDRQKWNQWLKSHTPSALPPEAAAEKPS
jgi:transglutaminase-like putative cysteine protease